MLTPRYVLVLALCLAFAPSASAQDEARLSVSVDSSRGLVVAIQPAFHVNYGCLYPITYRVQVPPGPGRLWVARRHSSLAPWDTLPERTSGDHFNGIEAVRFDSPGGFGRFPGAVGGLAHVSAAFSGDTDSLFLRISDSTGTPVSCSYQGIDTYYDGRRAVVTGTADDWDTSQNSRFCATLAVFRSYGLYVTAGVITGSQWCSAQTWASIQKQVDSGFVEVASHSRTHTNTPYADPSGEVQGSADDIVSHLRLPALFSSNGREYVYVWISPFGGYDAAVDSLVGTRQYLVPRLYDHSSQWDLSGWNAARDHFGPIQSTMEIGAPSWGGGSTDASYMNRVFDSVVSTGGVYHLMWHPQAIGFDLNQPYVGDHLGHISGRNDLWYANLGHVYLYHMIQEQNRSGSGPGPGPTAAGTEDRLFALLPNRPNPLGSTTTIGFEMRERALVSVRVFNVLGERVATLLDGPRDPGSYTVSWDARKVPSGVYFCRFEATMGAGRGTAFTSTRKMLVMR
jgi:hypothetical protein